MASKFFFVVNWFSEMSKNGDKDCFFFFWCSVNFLRTSKMKPRGGMHGEDVPLVSHVIKIVVAAQCY